MNRISGFCYQATSFLINPVNPTFNPITKRIGVLVITLIGILALGIAINALWRNLQPIEEENETSNIIRNLFKQIFGEKKEIIEEELNPPTENDVFEEKLTPPSENNVLEKDVSIENVTSSPPNSWINFPDDLYRLIFANKTYYAQDLVNIRRVCKAFNSNFTKNITKEFILRKQAEDLAEEWKNTDLVNDTYCGWYRNSHPTLHNMGQALEVYAKTFDLDQKTIAVSAEGQWSIRQPDRVGDIFEMALDLEQHGGFQQTLIAAKKEANNNNTVQYRKDEINQMIPIADKICKFINKIIRIGPLPITQEVL